MKVIVCGGRDFQNPAYVRRALTDVHKRTPITMIATGRARGADSAAEAWAMNEGIDVVLFPANWVKHGRAAGPIRNSLMLGLFKPDMVIAFPGGAGTADMTRIAKAAGVPVVVCEPRLEQAE